MNSSSSFSNMMASHQKFVEVDVSNSPILRRTSATEAVISVCLDDSGRTLSYEPMLEEDSSSSLLSSFNSSVQRQLEEFSESSEEEMRVIQEEEEEARRQHLRRAEARGQRGHVHKNVKIILRDDEKFRQFKQAIKNTGMLTAGGVKQVLLSPTVNDR